MLKKLAKLSSYLVILSLPLFIIRFNLGGIPSTLLEMVIYLSFVLNLIAGRLKVQNKKIFFAIIIFLLAALVGAVIDPQLARGLGLWKAYFFDGFLVYLIFSSSSDRRYLPLLSVSGIIAGILALIFGGFSQDGRLLGADGLSSNYLSMFVAPIAILVLVQIFRESNPAERLLYAAAEIFLILILILTDSRGAYVAIAGGLLVMAAQKLYQKKDKTKVTVGLILTMIILLAGTYAVFKPTDNDMGRAGSSSNIRYYIWQTSFSLIQQNPILGLGLGNYQDRFKEFTDGWVNYNEYIAPQALTAHNLYLHLYLTTGLPGLISFVVLIGLAIKKSKNRMLIPVLATILIYGLVDTTIYRNDLSIFFWIILGLL